MHKQTNKQTDRQSIRQYENNCHLAVNQLIREYKTRNYVTFWSVGDTKL